MKKAFSTPSLAIAAGLALAWAAAGQASAGVTFVQADTDATTSAYANVNGGMDGAGPLGDPVTYASLPNGTTNPAHSNALTIADPYDLSTHSFYAEGMNSELATPDFSSASAGMFTFVGSSSAYMAAGVTGMVGGQGYESGDYEFTVDTTSNLDVSYSATATGTSPKDYFVSLTGKPTFFFDNKSGVIDDVLAPGTYTLGFGQSVGADEIFLDGPGGTISSSANATFSFNISPVPEPAAWATMLIGLFGAGAMLRRSRRNARTPLALG